MKDLLGKTGKDVITGFEGVITGEVQYISGCNQVLLVPTVGENGTYREGQWFDESRIKIQEDIATVVLPEEEVRLNPGPDREAPKR